jgi:hypothetical protein
MALRILKRITNKWHIKLLSIILAVVLWFYVDSIKEEEHLLSVPVEVRNLPSGYTVANKMNPYVDVVLKGKESGLALVEGENLEAHIDLENSTVPEQRVLVKINKKNLPLRVKIKDINPRMVDILVERIGEKTVKVIPVIVGRPYEGHDFEDVIIKPEYVQISGPESMVRNIDSVYTDHIDIKGLTETTEGMAGLDPGDSKISLVDTTHVSVKIIIREGFIFKRIAGVSVIPLNVKEGLSAETEDTSVELFLKIPKRKERQLTLETLRVYIDCSSIDGPGKYLLSPIFEADFGEVDLIKIEPQSVEVKIREKT